MDLSIRELEKEHKLNPGDPVILCRLRSAYIRSGEAEKALPVLPGDTILISERDSGGWVAGSWEAKVVTVESDGGFLVEPITEIMPWKIQPSHSFIKTYKLYILPKEFVAVVSPATSVP